MIFNREIERKWAVGDKVSFGILKEYLNGMFPEASRDEGTSQDIFWKVPNVDFIRLRENTRELTVKVTDLGSIYNRLEENMVVPDFSDARRWATAVWGREAGALTKHYVVYTLPDAYVSLYMVEGAPQVFLEVEAKREQLVEWYGSELAERITLHPITKSLYQLFVEEAQ